MQKTIRVLVVIQSEENEPVKRTQVIAGGMSESRPLRKALEGMRESYALTDEEIEDIVSDLTWGRACWVREVYCFDCLYLYADATVEVDGVLL